MLEAIEAMDARRGQPQLSARAREDNAAGVQAAALAVLSDRVLAQQESVDKLAMEH